MSKKIALIIANSEYADSGLAKLSAPGKDAADFARVLEAKEIGAFDEATILLNQPQSIVSEAIDDLFEQKNHDDLLLLYFSGHGVRDDVGSLYLAVKNTNLLRLRSTAIKSDFIREAMDQSHSKRQVLILDCCYSGAFAQGTKSAIGASIGTAVAFEGTGYGRVVLTASDSIQYAWQGENVIGGTENSLFTHFLVKGLEGDADIDGDGRITVDELYNYAYNQITSRTAKQTPGKWAYKQHGELVLRQNISIKPLPLPGMLLSAIENPLPYVREGAIRQLEDFLRDSNLGIALSARAALEKIAADDDSSRVREVATQILLMLENPEQKRLVDEKAEADREAEIKRIADETAEATRKAEIKRIADEKAEATRKAEIKRIADEKAEAARKAEINRIADEKAEADRKAEIKRIADEKTEAARKAEIKRIAHEKTEAARKAEIKRIADEKTEAAREAEIKLSTDVKQLHQIGYAQVLSRRINGYSSFSISFSIICILAGGISAFPAAFNTVGAGGAFFIWLIGGCLAMSVSFGMGQLASAFPTAGGVYYWSSRLGGRGWGWATAWFNLIGLICLVSSIDVLLYSVFFRDLLIGTVLGLDVSAFGYWHQFIFLVICLTTQALLNHFGIGITKKITDFSSYLIFGLAFILIISLFAFSPVALDFSRLFQFQNFTGDAGGSVVPFRTENMAFAFLLGLSYVCYTITGFDVSANASEETINAQVNVPKGMWKAVFWSWLFGLLLVTSFVLTMPNVEEGAASGWGSFFYLWGASNIPYGLSLFIVIGLFIVNYICALAGLASVSRMMFAFARDSGMPRSLSRVNTTYRTPTNAIWVSTTLALLSTVYAPYYLILAVACAVFLYISMVMPIAAGFFAEGKKWKEKGSFNLGIFSKPNAIIAVLGGLLIAFSGFFPPNEKVFYFTIVMVIIMPIVWYGFERNRFEGIPEGDRIKERQKVFAETEAKYRD